MLKLMNLRNKKGYLLLEAVVSIAVVAIALVVILRSFASSLRASKISQEYFSATLFLNNKLCELEQKVRLKGGLNTSDSKEGEIPGTGYKLNVSIEDLGEIENLASVKAVIFWENLRRREKIEVETFMRYKDEI
ncbi:MAG: hypothetical protein V1933_03405 [Candidatus Omnitrophota bacterium]